MLVASLVVKMNIECVKIEVNGNGATVGSESGCMNKLNLCRLFIKSSKKHVFNLIQIFKQI